MGRNRPDTIHVTVEALKLAFADRDVYYADPLFADVPLAGLLSPRYAEHATGADRPAARLARPAAGRPPRGQAAAGPTAEARRGPGGPARDTTTCLVADGQGNVVAATPSGWSGVAGGRDRRLARLPAPELQPLGRPPELHRAGQAPADHAHARRSCSKDGRPILAVSVAGGDNQDQVTLQLLLDLIDFGLTPAEAVTAPRFLTEHFLGSFRQTPPKLGSLEINPEVGEDVLAELRAGATASPSRSRAGRSDPPADRPRVRAHRRRGGPEGPSPRGCAESDSGKCPAPHLLVRGPKRCDRSG